jgi:hypothetical protein
MFEEIINAKKILWPQSLKGKDTDERTFNTNFR